MTWNRDLDTTKTLAKAIIVCGILFIFFGLTQMRPLSFSIEAAALVVFGGILLALGSAISMQVSRKSPRLEKISAVLVCIAIMLVVLGIVTYMVVDVEYTLQDSRPMPKETRLYDINRGTPRYEGGFTLVSHIRHIYEKYSLLMFTAGITLISCLLFIKSRI